MEILNLNMKKQTKHILKFLILFLIQTIEKFEYRNVVLNEDDISKKIMNSINVSDTTINTPSGYKSITEIHKTQPYRIWYLETEKGLKLEGADNHILMNSLNRQVFIKDLRIGDVIQTKFGPQKVKFIKKGKFKVSMYDVTVDSKEHTFYSNDIVSHNTTTISAFFAWYLCFHADRNLAILANRHNTAVEIVGKVIDVFKGLPFFLKPGIVNANQSGLRLDNGCQLMSQATTKTAQIGFTIHVLYADEFAHIPGNIVGDFWRSVYPTLSSSHISQCIITSTPAGQTNLFYEIWDKAVKKINSFKYKRVDYWEVPGQDETWASRMRANFSDEYFAQEFELQFNVDSKLLLGTKEAAFLKKIEKTYKFKDLEKTDLDEELYRNLKWRPDFDPNEYYDPTQHLFVISVDTGEGKEYDEMKDSDYNVLSIYQLEPKSLVQLNRLRKDQYLTKHMFRLNQVGLYRDNFKDEEIAAKIAKSIVYDQLGAEACLVVLEMNFNGKFFLNIFQQNEKYYDDIVMRTYHTKPVPGEKPPKRKHGFKVGNDKEHFCKEGRSLIRDKSLIPNDTVTILEFASFGRDKRGKYKGIGAHDDTVMATLNIARLHAEPMYEDRLYDMLEFIDDSPQKQLIQLLIDRVEANTDLEDDMFNSLYDNNDEIIPGEVLNLNEIFKTGELAKKRYKVSNRWGYKKG